EKLAPLRYTAAGHEVFLPPSPPRWDAAGSDAPPSCSDRFFVTPVNFGAVVCSCPALAVGCSQPALVGDEHPCRAYFRPRRACEVLGAIVGAALRRLDAGIFPEAFDSGVVRLGLGHLLILLRGLARQPKAPMVRRRSVRRAPATEFDKAAAPQSPE